MKGEREQFRKKETSLTKDKGRLNQGKLGQIELKILNTCP
jgi:hypothetical protein